MHEGTWVWHSQPLAGEHSHSPSCSAVLIKVNVLFKKNNDILLKLITKYYQAKFNPVAQRSNLMIPFM